VVGVILWKVIPTFAALFSGLGAELPLPTRIVIAMSTQTAIAAIPPRLILYSVHRLPGPHFAGRRRLCSWHR